MVVNKGKKNRRFRGSKSHGWGSMKKHRGSGNRGGKGMAGSGKRADSKKPSIWKGKYFGKFGFKSKKAGSKDACVNIKYIEDNLHSLIKKGIASEKGGVYEINCGDLGFTKLLGEGKVTKKLKITVENVSKVAVEKISQSGGEVIKKK